MNTIATLREARNLMQKAEELITQAAKENPSLEQAYGSTLDSMKSQLNIMADNSRCYMTADHSLDDVILREGEDWNADGTLTDEQKEDAQS